MFRPQPHVLYTDKIEQYGPETGKQASSVTGTWEFYKNLRRTGLDNDQILILIRRFQLDMSMQQIMDELGFTSRSYLYLRYRRALELLQHQNFKFGGIE